jgi:hypothetical protein
VIIIADGHELPICAGHRREQTYGTPQAEYLAATGVAVVSRESIRQVLHDGGINWLATKTWKASTDPQFLTKMRRVLDLYDHPPADGRVICADLCRPRDYAEGQGLCLASGDSWMAVARHSYRSSRNASILSVGR